MRNCGIWESEPRVKCYICVFPHFRQRMTIATMTYRSLSSKTKQRQKKMCRNGTKVVKLTSYNFAFCLHLDLLSHSVRFAVSTCRFTQKCETTRTHALYSSFHLHIPYSYAVQFQFICHSMGPLMALHRCIFASFVLSSREHIFRCPLLMFS